MRSCSVEGCQNPVKGRSLCDKHLQKARRYGEPLAGYSKRPNAYGALCAVSNCAGHVLAQGYCSRHYQAFRKHSDPMASRPKRADNTGCVRTDGYIIRSVKGKRILDHVQVAERALGHPLPPGAVVHHWDGNPSNNTPRNLVICPSQAYHMALHARMRALKEQPSNESKAP